MHHIVVDTDLGVDDAAAVAWLFLQADYALDIVGISAVWGNASVEHVVSNVHAVLEVLGRSDVPVVMGSPAPLARRPSRVGAIAHGPDGLWGHAGTSAPRRSADLVEFYRGLVRSYPDATLLALGPLTNLALLVRDAPDVLRAFRQIVVLGGAKHHGSITPVAETNFWHDPEAARNVLAERLPVTLVTRDAHRAFTFSQADLDALVITPTPTARFLAGPMRCYARATQRFGEDVGFPDVVAAIVAADASVATRVQPALVHVVASDELTRGQSIIGLTHIERLTMIQAGAALDALIERVLAEPTLELGAAVATMLAGEPDNARVVLEIDVARVRSSFMRAMTLTEA